MIAIMNDQHRPSGKTRGEFGLEPAPGRGGLRKPRVVFGIMRIGEAGVSKRPLALKMSGRDQPSVVRAMIEVGQRIEKPRRGILCDRFACGRR